MSAVPLTSTAVEPTTVPSPSPRRGRTPRVGAEPSKAARLIILIAVGLVFLVPLGAMFEFTLRTSGKPGVYSFAHYASIFHTDPALGISYEPLFEGIRNSLLICLLTVAIILLILLPTMLLVELRYPRVRRVLEFVCILPITVPSIVLVVGFVPVYQRVAAVFGSQPWTLAFAVGIIVLPYAYRPIATNIAAFDLVTLTEAARSLGASWPVAIYRVILPNMRRGVISAVFLTVAVVLGEYTIAAFLSQNTFQTALLLISQTDSYVATIFALAALVFAFVILLIIGRFGAASPGSRRRRPRRVQP
ncbi:putative spermidine/putrescine transport system permease protein [Frondihabitans sp. PhB188]|uniref:ABC transporter permease n=1 Tax=Frondihabitans sp. PhB188 TaxID=2485200 RepID=UPI000F49ED2A|nr:ABC transporter permease subunit [Frondihabitans sp. PhB188]ROQ37481.1 putative spermidine/putrescine transport system permease protein [Frondihabitans sp. PhB188]